MKIKFRRVLVIGLIPLVCSFLYLPPGYGQSRELQVGAARVDITPPVNPNYPPSGKFDHEKLYVRAIVVDNGESKATLISADIADITTAIWEKAAPQIGQRINCPVENIIISATHSHSACPSGPPPPRFNDINVDATAKAILEVVDNANSRLQPAQVGFGKGEAYLNVNRDAIDKNTRLWTQAANIEGISDKTLSVMLFCDMQGKPVAGYMNYAMHPNNAYLSGITTADFPGAACCYIEEAFSNDMVMLFTQGASGDQNPRWSRPGTNVITSESGKEITGFETPREPIEFPLRKGLIPFEKADPKAAYNLERYIDALGVILGEEVIRVMSHIPKMESSIRIWGTQEVISLPGRKRISDKGREGEASTYAESEPIHIRLGLLAIGDIALSTIDAEIYTRFGELLKKRSPLTNTVLVTLSNGRTNSGYIVADSDYGKYTFQVLGCQIQPGYAEKGITDTFVKMIESYIKKQL